MSPWATAIDDGDPGSTQALTFNVTANTNPALFAIQPSVSPTGVLTYSATANASGTAQVTITLSDDGGTPGNPGDDATSAPQTFTITIQPVNDAPAFNAGPNQTVNEDSPTPPVNGWASGISPGPADESGQTLSFQVSNNNALFTAQPAVSPSGTLTYTLAANAFGSAVVTVTLSLAGTSLVGTLNNNTIGVTGVAGSGSATGNGLFFSFAGGGTITLAVTNNQILRYNGNAGIFADNTGGTYALNLTTTGNRTAEPGGGAFAGLALTAGAPASGDNIDVCAQIGGAGTLRNDFSTGDPTNSNDAILGVSTGASSMRLPGYAGTTLTDVQNFVFNNNNFAGTVVSAFVDPPATAANFIGGAACPTPP